MFSSSATPGAERALLTCESCGIDLPAAFKEMERSVFMVVAQDFQDPYTLNVRQFMKCCVEQITPDGRLIRFCAYNSVGYREQVRERMSDVSVAPVVPNAEPLQPRLEPTRYGSRTFRTESPPRIAGRSASGKERGPVARAARRTSGGGSAGERLLIGNQGLLRERLRERCGPLTARRLPPSWWHRPDGSLDPGPGRRAGRARGRRRARGRPRRSRHRA